MAGPSTCRQQGKKYTSEIFLLLAFFLSSVKATPFVFICETKKTVLGAMAKKVSFQKNSDGQSWYHDQYVPGKTP